MINLEEHPYSRIVQDLREIGEVTDLNSAEATVRRRAIAKGILHILATKMQRSITAGHRGRGAPAEVRRFYEEAYQLDPMAFLERFAGPDRPLDFRIIRDVVLVEPRIVMAYMTRRLGEIIAACEPENVCEVGCGSGRNLFYLAQRLNPIPCAGFDITDSAISAARRLQTMDLAGTPYGRLYGVPGAANDGIRKIDFQQASAFKLPVPDKSFDLVFTSAALEQMQANIDQAMSELRRVARRYVLMMEPFSDSNDMLGRLYLWAENYFRMPSRKLPRHGLYPVAMWRQVPVKPTFAYSFVLCRLEPKGGNIST